jgi:hypothetical protein
VRRFLIACPLLLVAVTVSWSAEDTKKAADTRKALKTKVSFKWKDTSFKDVMDEFHETVPALRFHLAPKEVNLNKQITYTCKDKPAEEVLVDLLGKNGWGYYVHSQKDAYDGDVYIKVGEERGYPKGAEPGDKPKEEKPKEEKPKDKPKDKPKTEPKEEKPKDKPTDDDPEKDANRKLKLAKRLIEDGMVEGARDALEEIIKKYKETKAAEEAKELLKKLDK